MLPEAGLCVIPPPPAYGTGPDGAHAKPGFFALVLSGAAVGGLAAGWLGGWAGGDSLPGGVHAPAVACP